MKMLKAASISCNLLDFPYNLLVQKNGTWLWLLRILISCVFLLFMLFWYLILSARNCAVDGFSHASQPARTWFLGRCVVHRWRSERRRSTSSARPPANSRMFLGWPHFWHARMRPSDFFTCLASPKRTDEASLQHSVGRTTPVLFAF